MNKKTEKSRKFIESLDENQNRLNKQVNQKQQIINLKNKFRGNFA